MDVVEHQAFENSKTLLTKDTLLVHFNPVLLMCDASSYGHRMPDGGYVSRSLSKAERNYAQIEREALALVFGVKKFRVWTLFWIGDGPQTIVSLVASICTNLRLLLEFVGGHCYCQHTITFRKTQDHGNADALSRLAGYRFGTRKTEPPELGSNHLNKSPVTARHISVWTRRDPILYIEHGWPRETSKELSSKQTELSVYQGCVLWGARVVVPPEGGSPRTSRRLWPGRRHSPECTFGGQD